MNINFSTYASMLAWPNPNDGDMGINPYYLELNGISV